MNKARIRKLKRQLAEAEAQLAALRKAVDKFIGQDGSAKARKGEAQARLAKAVGVALLLALLTGCTVRGGWPRFVRQGEAMGWHGPPPDVSTNAPKIVR